MIPTDELEEYPKRTSTRKVAAAAAVVLLIGAIAYGVTRPARTDTGAGDVAPTFSLRSLDGRGTMSSEDLEGHPVVLNFWASWCGPCREEAPLFEEKWQQYEDQGVVFVGVVIRDTPESALRFVERFELTYPMLWDPDQTLARAVGLVGLPQTFFIDADGRFVGPRARGTEGPDVGSARLGAIEEAELDAGIRALLESGR